MSRCQKHRQIIGKCTRIIQALTEKTVLFLPLCKTDVYSTLLTNGLTHIKLLNYCVFTCFVCHVYVIATI